MWRCDDGATIRNHSLKEVVTPNILITAKLSESLKIEFLVRSSIPGNGASSWPRLSSARRERECFVRSLYLQKYFIAFEIKTWGVDGAVDENWLDFNWCVIQWLIWGFLCLLFNLIVLVLCFYWVKLAYTDLGHMSNLKHQGVRVLLNKAIMGIKYHFYSKLIWTK